MRKSTSKKAKAAPLKERDKRHLASAIRENDMPAITACLAKGFDARWSAELIELALSCGSAEIVVLLHKNGAQVAAPAQRVLENTLHFTGNWQVIPETNPRMWQAELILKLLTPETVRSSLLVPALSHAPFVRRLLELGADPNYYCASRRWRSVLALAIEESYFESAILLLDAGADPNWCTRRIASAWILPEHMTVLDIAVHCQSVPLSLMRKLLAKGAYPDCGKEDQSLLDAAITRDRSDLVELLLRSGAGTDRLLEGAFFEGRWKFIPPLVLHGAECPPLLTSCRKPPLDVLGFLLEIGAKFKNSDLMAWTQAAGVRATNIEEARAAARLMALRPQKLL